MPRVCTICSHERRAEIDQAIAAGNESNRAIASQWGVTSSSVDRHKQAHMTQALAAATSRRESQDDSLLDRIEHGYEQAQALYSTALTVLKRVENDDHVSLKAITAACQ